MTTQNPNAGPPLPEDAVSTEPIVSSALESISRAEVDIAIATARRYPRVLSDVKRNMLTFATLDQETAESCFYTLPRGGKTIQGPSVRLAEIAVSSYGNIRAGSRILQTIVDGPNPHVVVQAVAMDLEKNVQVSIEKRRRITKKKNKDHIDEDDINLAANAGSAIAFRDAVFKVIPLALIKPVFEQAKTVAIGDAKTLGQRRGACIEHFAKMGVDQIRVLAKVEKKALEDVTLGDVELLLGLHNAIRDGEVQIDEAFPPVSNVKTPQFPPTTGSPAAQRKPEPPLPPKETAKEPEKAPEQAAQAPVATPEAAAAPAAAEPTPAPATAAPTPAAAQPAANTNESEAMQGVRGNMQKSGVNERQVMGFCLLKKIAKPEQVKLSDLSEAKLQNINKAWNNIVAGIKDQPKE